MKFFILIMATITCVMINHVVYAHPADGCHPNPLPAGYSSGGFGLPADFTYGDLSFGGPYPDEESMTDAEKYIISGATCHNGNRMQPWYHQIYQIVNAIYERTGEVPAELTIDHINSVTIGGHSDPSNSLFISPITGDYPRFNAKQFERGQVYVRPLTQDEKEFLSSRIPELYQHWIENISFNPETGCEEPIIISEVFYIRIYGESSVIYEGVKYTWINKS